MSRLIFILAAVSLAVPQDRRVPASGHWPQWRGPNRDGVSTETGLLKEWPEGGPKLLWKSDALGEGVPPVSVAGGLIFGLGYREGKEWVTALDGDGKAVWSQVIGTTQGEFPGMRYLSQRAPTVDDERVFAITATGNLSCLASADGRILWQKDYAKDLGGKSGSFNVCDAPLVDGILVILRPGGSNGTLAALNKVDGSVVWRSSELKDPASHAAIVPAEIGSVRQYVLLTMQSVAGIAAKDGKLLWRADRRGATVVIDTPIVHKDFVFVTSGFGIGCNAFRITSTDGQFKAEEVYSGKQMQVHHGGVIRVGDHVFALVDQGQLKCLELKTGTEVWADRCVGKGSILAAEGHLICRSERGPLALVEATPKEYRVKGRFDQPDRSREAAWSHPVVAGGRLYVRDVGTLFCYDLRGPDYKEPLPVWKIPVRPAAKPVEGPRGKAPDASFVPTPQDVVEKMLEAAKIGKEDVVYDLGSGDGRILIAAAKKFGCKGVGYEIAPDLVKLSRARAVEAKVDALVTIEEKDLFAADLSPATVITLYLGAPNNAKLLPQLRKLKPGSRIVSHAHLLGDSGPKPDQEVKMTSVEDGAEHTLFVWVAPLKP